MSQQYPETEDGEEARNGEASHEIGAYLINDHCTGPTVRSADKFVGKQAANGVIFTDEMYEVAKEYADNVGDVMRKISVFGGPGYGVEKRLIMPQIHDKSFGTTDAFLFNTVSADLYVWDYKFGYEIVEAFENWQSINYVNGIIKLLPTIKNWDPTAVKVHIRIAQPRAYHRDGPIREWVVTLAELQPYFDTLSANAHIALSDQATIHPGKHCKHCTARHACPASLQYGLSLYELAMSPTPIELSPEALGVQLAIIRKAVKQLEYLQTGFEEQATAVIKRGGLVPNFIVEMGTGRLAWNKPKAEIIKLGQLLGVDLKKDDEPITPTQAKKLGIDDAVINAYSDKPKTGLKLVEDDCSKARRTFK